LPDTTETMIDGWLVITQAISAAVVAAISARTPAAPKAVLWVFIPLSIVMMKLREQAA
jgi:hypothetical protein